MNKLTNNRGSILTLAVGLIVTLLFATLGMLNLGYLLATRFQLQSELDSLALQLVQQIDYDRYFNFGYSDALGFDLSAIDDDLVDAAQAGELQKCGNKIDTVITGLTIGLEVNCQVGLPLPIPGLPAQVSLELGSSARLAQAAG